MKKHPLPVQPYYAGRQHATTDADGIFTLQNVQMDANAGFGKVEKEGFFTGSSTFMVNANSVQPVAISLIAKAAALSLSIPLSLQATAPATMPLWYFDERKGMRQEQGTATRQGNAYVGTGSHALTDSPRWSGGTAAS